MTMEPLNEQGKIMLSHTVLPEDCKDLVEWGNTFPVWEDKKKEEFERWLGTLFYNKKKAYN